MRVLCVMAILVGSATGCQGATRVPDLEGGFLNKDCPEFWSYQPEDAMGITSRRMNSWYSTAKFGEVSPNVGMARFAKGPRHQGVFFRESGEIEFRRTSRDDYPHSMVELAAGRQVEEGLFRGEARPRMMSAETVYEVELQFFISGESWFQTVDWAIVFQGHAIPNRQNKGFAFNPPFAVVVANGELEVHVRADERRRLPRDRMYSRNEVISLGEIKSDVTTKLLMRVVWDYTGRNAVLELERDGQVLHRERGVPNFYNMQNDDGVSNGPYLTLGLYMPFSAVDAEDAIVVYRSITLRGGVRSCGGLTVD